MFIKLGRNIQSKDEIELAVHKAFWEVLIEVLSFGFGDAVLVSKLLGVLFLDYSVGYDDNGTHDKQTQK